MNRFFHMSLCGVATVTTLFVLHPTLADEGNLSTDQRKNSARMNCGARIECVTPDGHTGQVSKLPVQDPSATALIMDDDTVTCLLQEGETNFVIELPHSAVPDRFTFLNENTGARGELKIAVSNRRLPADSPEWTEVEGIVPFAHKRLFGVSLIGIEARFVRLSFHVEKEGRIAAIAADGKKRCDEGMEQHNVSAQLPQGFQNSSLDDALNSKFAALYSQGSRLLLTANFASVAPLPPMSSD
jgi:hypothetical protein